MIKKILRTVRTRLSFHYYIVLFSKNWINPFLTLYVNFYFLPFSKAKKLPIWIYQKTKIFSFDGSFAIDTDDIYSGMIKIGRSNESATPSGGYTEIINKSRVVFKGTTLIGCGCRILVYGKGILIFGDNLIMNNQNAIGCCNSISIGNSVTIANQTQIYDTDFHFLYNIKDGTASPNAKKIVIGDYCWIANRVSIMKGTVLPKYTIVSSNSLCNKRYEMKEGGILAGMPAKEVASGYAMIRKHEIEGNLYRHFDAGNEIYEFSKDTNLNYLAII